VSASPQFERSENYLDVAAGLDTYLRSADLHFNMLRVYSPLTPATRIFEVGVGTGWFLIACAERGLQCSGLELNPIYIEHARALGRSRGLELDIAQGDVQHADIGDGAHDIVFATSVFEHVPDPARGLANVYRALRPGGLLYFYSTNKFALRSGEFDLPLYGWLPASLRRRLRVARSGQVVVDARHLDFNQFTYFGLHRTLRRIGFSRVIDIFDHLSARGPSSPTPLKRAVLANPGGPNPLRTVARVFYPGTSFICIK
jgi:SAM-dependent methyltransferase